MQSRLVRSGFGLALSVVVGACGSSSKHDTPGGGAAGSGGAGGAASAGVSGSGASSGSSGQAGNGGASGSGGSVAGSESGGAISEGGAGGAETAGEGGSAGEPEIPVECGMIQFVLRGADGGPALCEDICSEDWLQISDPKGRPLGGAFPPAGCLAELYWMSKAIGTTRPIRKCIAGTYRVTMCAHLDPDAEAPETGGLACEPKGAQQCVEVEFEASATEVVGVLQ